MGPARTRPRARSGALACGLAAVAGLILTPALAAGASRTATLSGWGQISAALEGRHLAFSDALTALIDPDDAPGPLPPGLERFRYYRLDAGVIRLDGSRTRFTGESDPQVTMRTSVARLPAGAVDLTRSGRFAVTAGAVGFPTPVVWCCTDDEGVEVVLASDGRADAPRPLAVATDGARRVRWVARETDGSARVHVADPLDPSSAVEVPFPGRPDSGRLALAGTLAAWVEEGAPQGQIRVGRLGGSAAPRTVPVGGRVLELHASDGEVLALTRVGARYRVVRIDRRGRVTRPWSGSSRPKVAIGGGAIALSAGRRVLAGRGRRLEQARRARGRVAALAVDRNRVAVFERRRVKRQRATVVRLWKVP